MRTRRNAGAGGCRRTVPGGHRSVDGVDVGGIDGLTVTGAPRVQVRLVQWGQSAVGWVRPHKFVRRVQLATPTC